MASSGVPADAQSGPQPERKGPVVGIGASAGGLEAFSRFLRHLPPDTGYGFVLVQHLDASHPSSLSAILGRATTMPVAEATDGARVAPNHVYVIPPNTTLTISDQVLRLTPRSPAVAPMAVDRFLQSLADDCGDRAAGIVLSGNGSDGAIGLRAVRRAGGMTFAQEPTSAEFPGMPSAAAAAGGADLILPPEAIAAELARISRHPYFDGDVVAAPEPGAAVAIEDAPLRAICDVMREATGIDFASYRETTVQRRVLRRLAIVNMTSLGDYARLLAGRPAERAALQRDLLIGVTSFFRDPESFEVLKARVFPRLVQDRPANATIRVWVPGCATGEEAYSILIALREFQADAGTAFPVQVFASDVNEGALEKARSGTYDDSIAVDVSPERLNEHFVKINGHYQIVKSLRERCVFSRHNLLDDPPFSRLDLVSCRNVLIYLDTVQRKVIPLFHYALVDDGFLMLGRSEAARHEELFLAVDARQRIYAKRPVAKRTHESFTRSGVRARRSHVVSDAVAPAPQRTPADLSREVDHILLSKCSPTGVLVDESLEVLEVRGRPAPFLGLTPGRAGFHLLKHVPDTGLFLELEKLIRETATTGQVAMQQRVPYGVDGQAGELNVEVTPLRRGQRNATCCCSRAPMRMPVRIGALQCRVPLRPPGGIRSWPG